MEGLPSPEILISSSEAIIKAFSDPVSFESMKNKWAEIKNVSIRSESFVIATG